jgi:hypothetical protein
MSSCDDEFLGSPTNRLAPPNNGLLAKGNHFIKGCDVYTWGNAACNYIVVSKLDKHETDAFVDSLRARGESGSY